jgi:hypothetical protein
MDGRSDEKRRSAVKVWTDPTFTRDERAMLAAILAIKWDGVSIAGLIESGRAADAGSFDIELRPCVASPRAN